MKQSMLGRREFLKTAGVFATLGALAAAQRRPNLLFILASQWRAQALGDPGLQAPNLARLAKQGIQFNRMYTVSPLGSPARASLITGRFPFACGVPRNGIRMPLDQPSIAQQLKSAGYQTGFIGEWLLDGPADHGVVPPGPRRRGFDYWAATGFDPDSQTGLAIEFLRRNRQNPFFLFLAWSPPPARTPSASYYDSNVGRLVRALDEQHLANDIIVVFTSDYGDMLGSHGLQGGDEPF